MTSFAVSVVRFFAAKVCRSRATKLAKGVVTRTGDMLNAGRMRFGNICTAIEQMSVCLAFGWFLDSTSSSTLSAEAIIIALLALSCEYDVIIATRQEWTGTIRRSSKDISVMNQSIYDVPNYDRFDEIFDICKSSARVKVIKEESKKLMFP